MAKHNPALSPLGWATPNTDEGTYGESNKLHIYTYLQTPSEPMQHEHCLGQIMGKSSLHAALHLCAPFSQAKCEFTAYRSTCGLPQTSHSFPRAATSDIPHATHHG
jgi:hypothetical protein